MTRPLRVLLPALALLVASGALADPMMGLGPGMGPRRGALFLRQLFLPELVMQHQQEIGLTDAQRTAITDAMVATQRRAVELRWPLEAKGKALDELLAAPRIDEEAAMRQVGELMELENQMKRAHLQLLIRVKNVLTPQQQATLAKLRPARARRPQRPDRRTPPPPPSPPDDVT